MKNENDKNNFLENYRGDVDKIKDLSIICKNGHSFFNNFNKKCTMVDLGGCHGAFSKSFKTEFPNSKIYIVEANPHLIKKIQDNFDGMKNVEILNKAVSNKDEEIELYINKIDTRSSIMKIENDDRYTDKVLVKTISINSLIQKLNLKKINLLKIDIEGAEWESLDDFSKKNFDIIDQITIEFHDFMIPSLKYKTEEIIKKLTDLGYSFIHNTSYKISPYMDCLFFKEKIKDYPK